MNPKKRKRNEEILETVSVAVAGLAATTAALSALATTVFSQLGVTNPSIDPLIFLGEATPKSTFADDLFSMDDEYFEEHLGMMKETFNELVDIIGEHQRGEEPKRRTITNRESMAITLWYLCNNTSFTELNSLFGYKKGTLHSVFHRTLNFFNEYLEDEIKWPLEPEDGEKEFRCIAGFPGIIGGLGEMSFKLRPLVNKDEYSFKSMGMIAVVDAKRRFIFASAGFPEDIRGQEAFDMSPLSILSQCPSEFFSSSKYHLIARDNFSLKWNLMTPHPNTLGDPLKKWESRYNKRLEQSMRIVDQTFAEFRRKFKCLHNLDMSIDRAPTIITTCVKLYNFIMMKEHPSTLENTFLNKNELYHCAYSDTSTIENSVSPEAKREYITRMFQS